MEDCSFTWETGVQDAQSTVMVTSISMLGQGRLYGVLQTVQIVKVAGYRAGVSPGVLLMTGRLSVTDLTRVHGNIVTTVAGMTGILE